MPRVLQQLPVQLTPFATWIGKHNWSALARGV